MDPRSVREVAARLGLRPTKQRGQNFVVDANTVRRIVAVQAGDVAVQVGDLAVQAADREQPGQA